MRGVVCEEVVSARQLTLAALGKYLLIADNRRWFACRPQRAATAEEGPSRGRGGRRQRMLRRWHARLSRWYSEFRHEHGIECIGRIHHELTGLTEALKLSDANRNDAGDQSGGTSERLLPSNSGRGLFPLPGREAVSSCRRLVGHSAALQRRNHHETTLVDDAMHGLDWLQDVLGKRDARSYT